MGVNDTADLWMVMAIIQEFKLDAVTLALEPLNGFVGMTVSSCRGFGVEKLRELRAEADPSSPRQGAQRADDVSEFANKLKLEVVVHDERNADDIATALAGAAHTGRRGDGKVFVWRIAHALRIRTMERGRAALMAQNE